MVGSQEMIAQAVQAYIIKPTDDGAQMALVLKVASGAAAYIFSHDEFARFAANVLARAAAEPIGEPATGNHKVAVPIDAISFGTPDPSDRSSVTVTSRLGRISLDLSLNADRLMRSFKDFLDRRRGPTPSSGG